MHLTKSCLFFYSHGSSNTTFDLLKIELLRFASTNNKPFRTPFPTKVLTVQNTPRSPVALLLLRHLSSWLDLKMEWHLLTRENIPQGPRLIVIVHSPSHQLHQGHQNHQRTYLQTPPCHRIHHPSQTMVIAIGPPNPASLVRLSIPPTCRPAMHPLLCRIDRPPSLVSNQFKIMHSLCLRGVLVLLYRLMAPPCLLEISPPCLFVTAD